MTNVYGRPGKAERRTRLFKIGVKALQEAGWSVERIAGSGKSSVRRITRQGRSRTVSIRTTQDTWLAFPRNRDDTAWVTLSEVDAVVAVSVDRTDDPKFALVHMIEGDEMRGRFDRAYAARKQADYSIPLGRGVWVALYLPEANSPVTHVGAGAGLENPPIARVPLESNNTALDETSERLPSAVVEEPFTIAEAKRRLALSFGVDPSNIKITIEA